MLKTKYIAYELESFRTLWERNVLLVFSDIVVYNV